ncbi:response regulator [Clostridium sp. SHJSY1]|uniref:response regulator transcription factor n=1 Tax=Clostridium sp. SHJSY1 TaxID=2942483 RepID=UPI0028770062|nr:response regulator [Clostridium sp. SHJSY1]MDS0527042.1 response regulator [Clostridium sp. SHJSY1]
MIRLLIVEDEPPIMRANVSIIKSFNEECKVVATAINGKKAIEELEKQKIDVVFTDIKMPIMDGLELAKYIRENYPEIITVITSGYSDFEYARKGIEFKVMDYILKPISKAKVVKVLENIKHEISRRNYEKKKEMLFERLEDDDSEIMNSQCSVILACAGPLPIYGSDMLIPAVAFWDRIDLNKVVSDILRTGEEYIISRGHTIAEQVIVIESIKSNIIKKFLEELFNTLRNDEITITLEYKIGVKMSEMNKVIGDLHNDLSRKIILTKSQILCSNDSLEVHIEQRYFKNQIEFIRKWLKKGDKDKVKSSILEVFKIMENKNATQYEVINFFDMIINYFYFNEKLVKGEISVIIKELYETINNFEDYYSAAEDMASVLLDIVEIDKTGKQPKLIEDIQEYLKTHYQKSITNMVLSKEFGFVPSYISQLFKQYNNGISPGEYLSNYRIEMAKKIMEEQPELLVKEIADMVGFHDAYYFSKIFKKKTGMWPTNYY